MHPAVATLVVSFSLGGLACQHSCACTQQPPPPTQAPVVTATPAPSATPSVPQAPSPSTKRGDWVGSWRSDRCPPTRSYPRTIDLHPDGTFTAQDLISPCPPGVTCVWSGIVLIEGTWEAEGETVTLTRQVPAKSRAGQSPFPTSLQWDADGPTEAGTACGYVPNTR